jgi:uncharacterized protein (TIGR02145 family)
MKHNNILVLILPLSLLLSNCTKEEQAWPLPMFSVAPNGSDPFLYSGRNVVLDARYSEDYHVNGSLQYRWDYENDGSWDTPFSDNPYLQVLYENPGYYNVRLLVMNNRHETSETIRMIEIWDESQFLTDNIYDSVYFSPAGIYLACREVIYGIRSFWTRQDLDVYLGDYTTTCYGGFNIEGLLYHRENDTLFNTPEGFRLPSKADWELLFEGFGGMEIAGLVFEEPSQTFIDIPYSGKSNESGLCVDKGLKSYYWTSDEAGADSAWAVVFEKDSIATKFIKLSVNEAISVKLVYQQP